MAREEQTPQQRAEGDLRAAQDSVGVINEAVSAGEHNQQVDSRVEANYQHLELVLARDHVIEYVAANSTDISAITGAIAAGKSFLGK